MPPIVMKATLKSNFWQRNNSCSSTEITLVPEPDISLASNCARRFCSEATEASTNDVKSPSRRLRQKFPSKAMALEKQEKKSHFRQHSRSDRYVSRNISR